MGRPRHCLPRLQCCPTNFGNALSNPGSAVSSQEGIGWAFENVLGLADVRSEPCPFLIDEEVEVGVVGAAGPIQPTFDPARADGRIEIPALGVTAVEGGNQLIARIMGIHGPGDHQLAGVVHTVHTLGFLFGLAEGGQDHCRQNGNNRDHHQQFNERKCSG